MIHVALDLTALEFIDSTGISVLIAEHKRTASAGGELIILTPHRHVRRVFEVSGLMDVLRRPAAEIAERDAARPSRPPPHAPDCDPLESGAD